MAKEIFKTSEKSNFILNMDLDWYRKACGRLILIALAATACSAAIFQFTYLNAGDLNDNIEQGGAVGVFSLLLIMLRSVASVFSVGGVMALIATVIGLMRKQFSKQTLIPLGILAASLAWGVVSMLHSYDITISVYGVDGRDEGWLALLMYSCFFFVGMMQREKGHLERLGNGLLVFGIVQCVWGLLQVQPWFDFPTEYQMIDPLLYQNLRLPNGFTDSPITFAMLLAMLLALAIPAAVLAEEKKTRVLALVCGGLSMLLAFKTQTYAGLIAGFGGLVLAGIVLCMKQKKAKKVWVMPVVMVAAALISACWTYFTPSINGAYKTYDSSKVENGFALYDGGIVWDDGSYRLSCSGAYTAAAEHDFDIHNAASVLKYCWGEGVKAIQIDPLMGVGPDNFTFTQLRTSMNIMSNFNAVDRPYNDLLFIAGTRGIPALLLHIALIVVCMVLAWKRRKKLQSWLGIAAAAAVVLYTATSMVGISVLTVAPLFWVLLGTLAAEPIEQTGKQKQKKAKK